MKATWPKFCKEILLLAKLLRLHLDNFIIPIREIYIIYTGKHDFFWEELFAKKAFHSFYEWYNVEAFIQCRRTLFTWSEATMGHIRRQKKRFFLKLLSVVPVLQPIQPHDYFPHGSEDDVLILLNFSRRREKIDFWLMPCCTCIVRRWSKWNKTCKSCTFKIELSSDSISNLIQQYVKFCLKGTSCGFIVHC